MLMVALSTAGYELFTYLYRSAVLSANVEMGIFIKKLIVEIIFNTLITIIIYPLMQRLGYKVEDVFKKEQILTRYF